MDVVGLFKSIGIPGYIAAAGILVYGLVVTFRPITTLTANIFEKKLFSKEKLFTIMIWRHFWQTVFWTVVFLTILSLSNLPEWTVNFNTSTTVGTITATIGEIIFAIILFIIEFEDMDWGFTNFFKPKWIRFSVVIVFVTCLILFYVALDGCIIGSIKGENQLIKLIYILGIPFIFSLPVPFLMRPVSRLVEWSKDKYIVIDRSEQERQQNPSTNEESDDCWYILHAVSKELILLGNKPNPKLCTETKIIKLDELCDKKMFIKDKT
ncbi:hypothetical protein G9F75_07010 [Bacillus sp. EKM208B]|uniref:hypothetical protein n=1 Tax=Bacillus TaxID=1386 RepID=UPI00142E5337|nr:MULTISPECIES: hypothetical protein [Bacillus]KAF6538651.1 hypothetical protein G9F75_07010 [Bacillus sp. EKM208B]MCM3108790.1 hypothetical protein [Bacillus velezensis]MDN4139845.1 hypothetical protein [Bacillus velezensis]MDV2629371.1 hypothetical protein [Bacillus velezensis]MED3448956.1 hypothetical protein [Bacillus velezensis]